MYRILRNNKEQGPYSLDELVQLSLRPYDLIWVEGKSACWRYPTEIDALKPYVNVSPTAAPVKETVPAPALSVPVNNEKPIDENSMVQEEYEITEAMLEQKANAIYQRVQAYNAQCEEQSKDMQTKYARSLDDLKGDYADWLHGKKRQKIKQSLNYKGWVAFGAVSAAFIIFVLAGRDKEIMGFVNSKNDSIESKEASSNNHIIKQPPSNATTSREIVSAEERATVEAFIDSMRNTLRKETDEKSENEKSTSRKKKAPVVRVVANPAKPVLTPVEEPVKNPVIKSASLDGRYLPEDNNSRIKEIQITVHNTGTIQLKQVVVDVFYYKKGERFLEQERLYLHNIGPGNSATISKPGNKKAVLARFELGQLTAE